MRLKSLMTALFLNQRLCDVVARVRLMRHKPSSAVMSERSSGHELFLELSLKAKGCRTQTQTRF